MKINLKIGDGDGDGEREDDATREARKEWDGKAELRAEFGDNFPAYVAYKKAEAAGRLKVTRPTIQKGA